LHFTCLIDEVIELLLRGSFMREIHDFVFGIIFICLLYFVDISDLFKWINILIFHLGALDSINSFSF
jgi:hypothetical protein